MSRNKITITLDDNLSGCVHQIERSIETILHSSKYLNLRHYEYEVIPNSYSNKQWLYDIKVKCIDDINEYMYLYVHLSNLIDGLISNLDTLQLLSDI